MSFYVYLFLRVRGNNRFFECFFKVFCLVFYGLRDGSLIFVFFLFFELVKWVRFIEEIVLVRGDGFVVGYCVGFIGLFRGRR